MVKPSPPQARARPSLHKVALVILIYSVVLVGGTFVADWGIEAMELGIRPSGSYLLSRVVLLCLFLYILLLALPFVPGVEIGVAMIMVLGPDIVPIVYLATVTALLLSFTIGRLVPDHRLAQGCRRIGLLRAAALIERLQLLSIDERIAYLLAAAPGRLMPLLLRRRHWAIAAALNAPGNYLIGGGGGIAVVAGMSRLLSFPGFALTVALATAPVPISILVFDQWG